MANAIWGVSLRLSHRFGMIVYLANKEKFREDILSNRIEEIVLESFQAKLGKSVGPGDMNHLEHIPSFST
jgi:hypothetical protein